MSVDLSELINQLHGEIDLVCGSEEEELRTEIDRLHALRQSVESFFADQADAYAKLADYASECSQSQEQDRVQVDVQSDISDRVIQGLNLLSRRLDEIAAKVGADFVPPKETVDPVLDSVMSQFELLQQDLARRTGEKPPGE